MIEKIDYKRYLVREGWCRRIQELIERARNSKLGSMCGCAAFRTDNLNHNSFLSSRNSRHQESYISSCVKFQMYPGAFLLGNNRSLDRLASCPVSQAAGFPPATSLREVVIEKLAGAASTTAHEQDGVDPAHPSLFYCSRTLNTSYAA